jgi:hypothetical protein
MDLPEIPTKNDRRSGVGAEKANKDINICILTPTVYTFLIMVSVSKNNSVTVNLDILNCGTGYTRAYICFSNPNKVKCEGKLKVWKIMRELRELYHNYSLGNHIIACGHDKSTKEYIETIDTKFLTIGTDSIITNENEFDYDDFVIESMD